MAARIKRGDMVDRGDGQPALVWLARDGDMEPEIKVRITTLLLANGADADEGAASGSWPSANVLRKTSSCRSKGREKIGKTYACKPRFFPVQNGKGLERFPVQPFV